MRIVYRLDDQIGYKLRLASQRHLEIFSQHLPNLTPTQFAILARLDEITECSQNQLGRMVAMDAATTKGVVSRLTDKGLVQSAPDPADSRRRLISLTKLGQEKTKVAIKKAKKITGETVANLNAKDTKRLIELLEKI